MFIFVKLSLEFYIYIAYNNCPYHNFCVLNYADGMIYWTRAKVIWQKATPLDGAVVCKRNIVDIFYYIRQLVARVTKLVLGVHLGPPFWAEGEGHARCQVSCFAFSYVISVYMSVGQSPWHDVIFGLVFINQRRSSWQHPAMAAAREL